MSARTGHEAEDKRRAMEATRAQFNGLPPPGLLAFTVVAYPPYERHLDSDNLVFMLKASRDGIAEALGVDDWQFWPLHIEKRDPVAGGKIVIRITSPQNTPESE